MAVPCRLQVAVELRREKRGRAEILRLARARPLARLGLDDGLGVFQGVPLADTRADRAEVAVGVLEARAGFAVEAVNPGAAIGLPPLAGGLGGYFGYGFGYGYGYGFGEAPARALR